MRATMSNPEWFSGGRGLAHLFSTKWTDEPDGEAVAACGIHPYDVSPAPRFNEPQPTDGFCPDCAAWFFGAVAR